MPLRVSQVGQRLTFRGSFLHVVLAERALSGVECFTDGIGRLKLADGEERHGVRISVKSLRRRRNPVPDL